jgi:hypothetical protein
MTAPHPATCAALTCFCSAATYCSHLLLLSLLAASAACASTRAQARCTQRLQSEVIFPPSRYLHLCPRWSAVSAVPLFLLVERRRPPPSFSVGVQPVSSSRAPTTAPSGVRIEPLFFPSPMMPRLSIFSPIERCRAFLPCTSFGRLPSLPSLPVCW